MTILARDFQISGMTVSLTEIVIAIINNQPRTVESRASEIGAVIDRNGRMHAPHDGWEFNGTVYRGGEYVHDEISMSERGKHTRIKMTVEQADKMIAGLNAGKATCTASKGKEFDGNVYLYLNDLSAAQKDAIENLFPLEDKILINEDQKNQFNVNTGKLFKYSHKKKLSNMKFTGNYQNWVTGECEENHGKMCGYLYMQIVG